MAKCGTVCQAIIGGGYGLASAYAYKPGVDEQETLKKIVLFPASTADWIANKIAESQGQPYNEKIYYIASAGVGIVTAMLLGRLLRG